MDQQLTLAQLQELRKAVRKRLDEMGIHDVVHSILGQCGGGGADQALELLKERGLVDELVRSLSPLPDTLKSVAKQVQLGSPNTSAFLHIKVLGGRAFTDYVAAPACQGETLRLCGELFGQRWETPAVGATSEPAFAGEAYIEMPLKGGGLFDPLTLLTQRQALHLVVVHSGPSAPISGVSRPLLRMRMVHTLLSSLDHPHAVMVRGRA